jgi:protein SCO1/2
MLTALLTAAVLAGCGGTSDENKFVGMTDVKLPDARSVALPAWGPGHRGEVKKLRPHVGEFLVVYFGYTFCPDVCPTTLSGLGAAVRSLPKTDQPKIEAGMVTVDPARDKGTHLVRYVRHFFPPASAWAFHTADKNALEQAERAFAATSTIDPHKPGENYSVTHTASLFVVDRSGDVVLIWPYGTLSEDIASDLKLLLTRESRGPTGS